MNTDLKKHASSRAGGRRCHPLRARAIPAARIREPAVATVAPSLTDLLEITGRAAKRPSTFRSAMSLQSQPNDQQQGPCFVVTLTVVASNDVLLVIR
jgi:hypothetical protein